MNVTDLSEEVITRFNSFVVQGEGCWQWVGPVSEGRGRFNISRDDPCRPNIMAMWLVTGIRPRHPEQVKSSCKNRLCVNPAHLYIEVKGDTVNNFWRRVRKTETCWLWTGGTISNTIDRNYGRFDFGSKRVLVHRFAYGLVNGEPPDDLEVCHRCDNPICVNPSHLFLGTHHENMLDRDAKERRTAPTGEAVGTSKLQAAEVLLIRLLRQKGWMYERIAYFFDIHPDTVKNICLRRSWSHI